MTIWSTALIVLMHTFCLSSLSLRSVRVGRRNGLMRPLGISAGVNRIDNRLQYDELNNDDVDDIINFEAENVVVRATTGVRYRFGKSLEESPALVLNANFLPISYLPLSIWHWQDSLRAVLSNKAIALHYYDIAIRSVSLNVQIPSVIVLKRFQKVPDAMPAMTRRNIYLRDEFRCQYCGERFPPSALSLDHVHPRSKGGKLTWTNTVCSCHACNHKKGSNLPQELPKLGMRLRSIPRTPSHYELQYKAKLFRKTGAGTHPSWETYL